MSWPSALVLSSVDGSEVTTRFVDVAVPRIVRPFVNVDDAARRPPESVVSPLKVSAVVVAFPTNPYPIVFVITPVEELYETPAPDESEVEDILLLNVPQSVDVSTPRFVADAVGKLKVICWPLSSRRLHLGKAR